MRPFFHRKPINVAVVRSFLVLCTVLFLFGGPGLVSEIVAQVPPIGPSRCHEAPGYPCDSPSRPSLLTTPGKSAPSEYETSSDIPTGGCSPVAEKTLPPNVTRAANGKYFPASGYTWVNSRRGGLRVRPLRIGERRKGYSHVVWTGDGWRPQACYKWSNTTGFQVQPASVGSPHLNCDNVICTGDGKFSPADGYIWLSSARNDCRVKSTTPREDVVVNVEIETRILPFDPLSGLKSLQTVSIDFKKKTIKSRFQTGSSNLFGEWKSVRDKFELTDINFSANAVNFTVRGQTASGVLWIGALPDIDYKFEISVPRDGEPKVTGCHDGYPAYFVRRNGSEFYSYRHNPRRLGLLFGTCDVVVD